MILKALVLKKFEFDKGSSLFQPISWMIIISVEWLLNDYYIMIIILWLLLNDYYIMIIINNNNNSLY